VHHGCVTAQTTWLRVARDVCDRITSGEYQVGKKIASTQQLATRNDASLGTVRRALEHLSEMGVVEGRQGIGVFVLRRPVPDDLGPADSIEDRVGSHEERLSVIERQLAELLKSREDPSS
jgi:GntR family transcriptional regulator